MNRNNSRQQPSACNQILLPAPILGNDKSDVQRPGWQTGPRRVTCHNYYYDGY